MQLIINGNTPSKKNSRINTKSGRSFPSAKYTAWHKEASRQIAGSRKIPENTYLAITFVAGDNRKFDLTNKAESIMDLLVDNKILDDDNYSVIPALLLRFGGVEKDNAHCIIEWS